MVANGGCHWQQTPSAAGVGNLADLEWRPCCASLSVPHAAKVATLVTTGNLKKGCSRMRAGVRPWIQHARRGEAVAPRRTPGTVEAGTGPVGRSPCRGILSGLYGRGCADTRLARHDSPRSGRGSPTVVQRRHGLPDRYAAEPARRARGAALVRGGSGVDRGRATALRTRTIV